MKALVRRGNGAAFVERPIPTAGPNDVVVKTKLASFCSADIACAQGIFPTVEGTILGHEAVGTVFEIGSEVSGFEIGDRVMMSSTTPCGTCRNCQKGLGGHCQGRAWGGYKLGVSQDGTLAEYFVVPNAQYNLVAIPSDVSDIAALTVVDSLLSGSSGAEAPDFALGSIIVVIGQGHIGLSATLTASILGASKVIAVKASPGFEEYSYNAGADQVLNLEENDIVAEILNLTNGRGVDCVIEASGQMSSFALALKLCRLGGKISVLSTYEDPENTALQIDLEDWAWGIGDKQILSTFQKCGSERVERLLMLISNNKIDPSFLFTNTLDFADLETVFNAYSSNKGELKPLIKF